MHRRYQPLTPPGTRQAHPLSEREAEIGRLICEGLTSKEMAVRLSLSESTVHVHRTNLRKKLRARNAADVVRMLTKRL